MKIITKPWFIPIVLTIVILAIGGYYMKHLSSNAETLPEDEIRELLEKTYDGKVERLSLEGTIYEAELSRNKGVYVATVDATTGNVVALIQTKEVIEEDLPIASAGTHDTTDETGNTEPTVQENVQDGTAITEPEQPVTSEPPKKTEAPQNNQQSKPNTTTNSNSAGKNNNQTTPPKKTNTALISENQAVKIALGQLKGEVDNIDFVKTSDGGYYLIEIDDNEDAEATFQIHAISGKILSVTWDD